MDCVTGECALTNEWEMNPWIKIYIAQEILWSLFKALPLSQMFLVKCLLLLGVMKIERNKIIVDML